MKKWAIIGVLLLSGIVGFFSQTNERTAQTNQIVSESPPSSAADETSIKRSSNGFPMATEEFKAKYEQRVKESAEANERGLDEWRTPIEFYGKVVDENENPVARAQIDLGTTDLSPAGVSDYKKISDENGLFSISEIRGKLLTVKINKEGYDVSKQNPSYFFYAGENQNFVPNPRNPVIFHLRKKGKAEPLIRFSRSFRLPKDGTPVKIDLTTGTAVPSGESILQVECWTQNAGKKSGEKFDWKCRVSVPGGGLQFYMEEFPFLAPEEGYVFSDEIDMTVHPDSPWQQDISRYYFVRTADGKYGRVVFRMIVHGDHFCRIESFLNPSGSRNLEYDEAVQPKQTVFE